MPFNKWNFFEIAVIALFVASLVLLYLLLVGANDPAGIPENEFKEESLRGAVRLALSGKGEAVQTKDFNFAGPGSVTAYSILADSGIGLMPEQLCFALGAAQLDGTVSGGAEQGIHGSIRYGTGVSGPYNFTALCYRASDLFEKIRENEGKGLRAAFFSGCPCFSQPQKICCVAALGKG